MKKLDWTLAVFPTVLLLIFIGIFALTQWNLAQLKNAYDEELFSELHHKAQLTAKLLQPMLPGKLDEALKLCKEFSTQTFRTTLITPEGTVVADSEEDPAILDNHRERNEVQSAIATGEGFVRRYSETLNRIMLYHAIPIKTESGTYVLRMAVSAEKFSSAAFLTAFCNIAMLFLAVIFFTVLQFYLICKVRRPLNLMQQNVADITSGKLNVNISIPSSGLVKDLAANVADMANQLKKQLQLMTVERNEKEAILNAMHEAVLLVAPNGDAVRFNRSAAKLFHLAPDSKFNLSRSGIAELSNLAHQTFESGKSFDTECELQENSGKRTLLVKGIILNDENGNFLLLTMTDLTNQRKLESFRSDFIANVSHEIKTPLTCIIGAVEALQEEPNLPKTQTGRLLKMIFNQSNRLNLLVRDILSLAALEHRQIEQQKDFIPLELDSVVANAVNQFYDKAQASGITLKITKNQSLKISGDAGLLEQSISNLISNAIKYSDAKNIEVSLEKIGNNAVIQIQDDGIGIPAEHHSRIFERFYRIHKERSRELGGTGLGLAIVKHIAALHHGSAELINNSPQGCSFRIIIPAN